MGAVDGRSSALDYAVGACNRVAAALGISSGAVSSAAAIFILALLTVASLPLLKRLNLHKAGKQGVWMKVATLTACYSICSSMLLILNKVAVTRIPAPSFILACQLGSTALFVKGMAVAGAVEAEPLSWNKSKKFALIVFGFIGTLFASVTSLKYVPVDTIICFRASCPLVIAIIEYFYLDRELPSTRSWLALFGVFGGVAVYTFHDIHFTVLGYVWLGIWYSFAVFEMVYVKKVVDTVEMTTWSRTYYQNSLATLPMLLLMVVNSEADVVMKGGLPRAGVAALVLSCVGGLGMSYFSFALRAAISATSFSVIGNICKVLTILVNILMWDQHANATGTGALLLCLGLGAMYQQAPIRQRSATARGAGKGEKEAFLPK